MTEGRDKSRDQPGTPDRDGFGGHEVARVPERRAPGLDEALDDVRAVLGDAAAEAGGGAGGVASRGAGRRGGGPSAPGTTAAIADNPTSNAAARLGMAEP